MIPGREDAYAKLSTSGGGDKRILDNIQYAYFSDETWVVINDPEQRNTLRHFIVGTFFTPEDQTKLWQVIELQRTIGQYETILESGINYTLAIPDELVRGTAFRRLVRHLYDYQCAVCGLRIITPDGSSPVDAAHLIPWGKTHDDSPTNGIALCKLHHWALDANLIAPTVNLRWVVSQIIDPRRNSERELTRFHKAPMLLPRQKENYPREEAILWRYRSLAKVNGK